MKSQVTTKKGDGGQTRALSGDHFPKCHPIMECVGNVDELRAQIGLLRQAILAESLSEAENHAAFLLWVMHTMFPIGSACSDPVNKHPEYRKLELGAEHIAKLEAEQ
ncbi:MAG: ATP:cob(I)alamin adenosyltransferase [Candidatus Hydrogenedentes bacterium]|nr:ATP:cob(I)alamin adenosyltransferase [Candidatus Hydrogenedentota bacterium]